MRGARRLVSDAEALHPGDRVKQCIAIIGRRGSWTDAFAQAEQDVAFDHVFRRMTDEETQVWARYCNDVEVPAVSQGMMWRARRHDAQERAA
jgi:hypothetical protein